MNKTITISLSLLATIALIVIGCTAPEQLTAPAEQTAEEVEVAGELSELDELEQLGNELDDLDWQEVEGAVKE